MDVDWQEIFYMLGTILIIGLAVFWSVLIYVVWKLLKRIDLTINNISSSFTKFVPLAVPALGTWGLLKSVIKFVTGRR